MNDPKIYISLSVVIALTVIVMILLLRNRITGFAGRVSKKGVDVNLKAAEPNTPGVDISGAKLKDENEVTADNEARLKATNLQAGDRNRIRVGSFVRPSDEAETKM